MYSPFKLNIFEESDGSWSNDISESSSNDILDEVIDLDEETEFAEPESKIDHHYDPKNSYPGAMKGGDLELSDDQWNDAIDAVQKSIKSDHKIMESLMHNYEESMDILETLRHAVRVPGSSQDDYNEATMLSMYDDGPWFEAANSKDSDEGVCKKKAKSLRNEVFRQGKKDSIDVVKVAVLTKGEVTKEDESWKIVGVVVSAKDAADGFVKVLEERLSKKLEDCRLTATKASKAQLEAINAKRKSPASEAYIIKVVK